MRNWDLYPKALTEMARASRVGTGRACLLTHDKKCMIKVRNAWKEILDDFCGI